MLMATAPATPAEQPKLPTPQAIDAMCMAVDTAAAAADKAAAELKDAKAPLLTLVRLYGSVPETAPRTKRLLGTLYVADSTVNTKTEIVDASVAALRTKLKDHRKSALFAQLFESVESFALQKNAAELLKIGIGGLPESQQTEILTLYAQCFNAKTNAPSLSVDLIEALREKESEAERKAEEKAAKAAKKAAREAKKAAKQKGGVK
jgi:hypothetical protein